MPDQQPHRKEVTKPSSQMRLLISIGLNVLITVAQVIGGIFSGSMALISDALHNFSDVIALVISYIANRLSKKEHTLTKTFGYKRAEILAAFINAATLLAIAAFLGKEAIERLIEPVEVRSNIVIWLAAFSIVMNGLSVLLIKPEAGNNLNMRSAYLHLFTDMLTSIAVLVGGIIMKYWGLYWVDSVVTILIALYLIKSSWGLMISSVKILLMFSPKELIIKDIANDLKTIEGVDCVYHVHVWQLNDDSIFFEARVIFSEDIPISSFQKKLKEMEKVLAKYGISHATLQPGYGDDSPRELINQE
ncbi:MAG: cation transporter [Bacteroidetes bacterium CG18_big_fil_WC_8_21_14_2_50_41_14]|nr:MAG: cation transporter [Bacteroidetes bacterium CG18_big_fil_WC_8_21_14_2_50_41_14]PJB59298.1 MAG: cation transporter [Bacteroidetes bacterium CG_4_9_14_3_um_filter_41_19]